MNINLDKVDLQILKDLQADGRMTNVKLAENAGISAPPCLRRVRALEDSKFIQGYHAELNGKSLGFHVTIFARVGLSSQSDADLRTFEAKVHEWPLVRECYLISGDADFFLKIVARDWDEYQEFYTTHLSPSPLIKSILSMLVIRTPKHLSGVPVELVKVGG